jgi:hypothetical protein
MARGFESKSVADQQESAQEPKRYREVEGGEPAQLLKRRKLELARADVLRRMETATAEGHREMLRRALAALDKDLKSVQ